MVKFKHFASAAAFGLGLVAFSPASAVVTTFATFSAVNSLKDFRLVNVGNSATRAVDGMLYTTSTPNATTPGSVVVKFSFLQPQLNKYINNYNATFTYMASVAKNTPAQNVAGGVAQTGISGSFSFLTTSAITVSGPDFITHTYAAGSNLLSGTFSSSTLFGSGSSAATSSSTTSGSTVVFTSDFLNFSNTVSRDRGLTLTAITPSLAAGTAANKSLKSFRASVGGQFSSDPAPLINGLAIVPEPATWALLVVGFGMVGIQTRRRTRSATVSA